MKNRITIRMGASKFEVAANLGDRVAVFDVRRMNAQEEKKLRVELVAQFREANLNG